MATRDAPLEPFIDENAGPASAGVILQSSQFLAAKPYRDPGLPGSSDIPIRFVTTKPFTP